MNACPSTDQLIRLLDEDLDPSQESGIVAHVEQCSACQGLLDALTRGQSPSSEWRLLGEARAEPERTAEVPSADEGPTRGTEERIDEDTTVTSGFPDSREKRADGNTTPDDGATVSRAGLGLQSLADRDHPGRHDGASRPASTDHAPAEDLPPDADETTSNAGTSDGVANASPAHAKSDWPAVPGYEILEELGAGRHGRRLQGPPASG